jgi:hypothetical protein
VGELGSNTMWSVLRVVRDLGWAEWGRTGKRARFRYGFRQPGSKAFRVGQVPFRAAFSKGPGKWRNDRNAQKAGACETLLGRRSATDASQSQETASMVNGERVEGRVLEPGEKTN